MGRTHFKGPVIVPGGMVGEVFMDTSGVLDKPTVSTTVTATTSLAVGSGTAITKIIKDTATLTIAAGLAAAEEDVAIVATGAAAGDAVKVTLLNAAAETGVGVLATWVSGADEITVRIGNLSGSTLTGSALAATYLIVKS
jgi:hypothetical protein